MLESDETNHIPPLPLKAIRAMESIVANDPEKSADDPRLSAELRQEIRELLGLLPPDVVSELNDGKIDIHDGAFLAGLTDHVSRLSLADPQTGKVLLGKLVRIKKLIRRSLRDAHEDLETSSTIRRSDPRVGRNDHCPCGSGRKYKDCCLRNRAGG
jgi:hypothetical protein